jgi:excisionase family DNA binding protein
MEMAQVTGTESDTRIMSPLMTYDEAARYLRISRSYIRQLGSRGEIPRIKIGGRVLFTKEMLDKWVAEHRTDR